MTPLIISPKRARVESALQKLVQLRDEFDGEERDQFEQQLHALAGRGESIASACRAVAALPISAPEALPNRRAIGRREATRTGRLLTALEQQERDSQRAQREANAQSRDDKILSQRRPSQGSTIVVNVDRGDTQLTVIVSSSSGATSEASDEETVEAQPQPEPEFPTQQQLPSSTAPPAIASEIRSKRRRAQSGFYAAMMDGDSQEMKRRR